ncbi:hypothetical protein SCCGRSA3_00237 [Marine Group I thaumarchaeote SCGC RSA3]|uniref:Transcriptional regulator protein n=2 Tax=Marine Group I TaxID=905826 RepID=A0A081RQH0_9ARCH|nr:transcriptional regulator protein [Marine Group I thaumarchaeote SCGC AAA799-N04]KFM20423.1 hypothetical protein SCCGRSA3_00237 [Marine Group I thaumarchaeote SCGC RSA3]
MKKFFSDEQTMTILQSLIDSPKSAQQLSHECNIPISSVYRKLQILKEKQLLVTSGSVTDDGVKTIFFQKK